MRRFRKFAGLALGSVVLVGTGCVLESGGSTRPAPAVSTVQPGDDPERPELIFRANGTKALRGILRPGIQARLVVDLERFTQCEPAPSENFRALAFTRGLRGPWTEHVVARMDGGTMIVQEPEVRVPAAFRMEVRFYVSNGPDCAEEDPLEGDPYWFPVVVPVEGAVIEFGATGDPFVVGELGPGRAVTVVYPLERLPTCRSEGTGVPSWEVEVIWRVNQITSNVALTAIEEPDVRLETPAGIDIPINGDSLDLRFRNWDHSGCEAFEPSGGESFRFSFDPP